MQEYIVTIEHNGQEIFKQEVTGTYSVTRGTKKIPLENTIVTDTTQDESNIAHLELRAIFEIN